MVRGGENGASAAASDAAPKIKLLVPMAKVGKIIGRRGAMIRELQEKSGCKISVTDDEEKGMKVVFLKGSDPQVKKARAMITKTIEDEAPVAAKSSPTKARDDPDGITIEFSIPEDKCGLVIGARGAKIREIQSETDVSVNVGYRDSAVDGLVKVTLSGEKERCDHARKVIEDLIDESNTSYEDAPEEPGYSNTITIPSDTTRKLIGPQGSTIRDIQHRSGAQVDVARRNTAVDGMINVTLSGAKEACDEAEKLINELLDERTSTDVSTMWIEESMCGLIIGSRGNKIRDIQNQSGANVHIDKRDLAQEGKVQVSISGTSEQKIDAQRIIEDIINDASNVDERGAGEQWEAPENDGQHSIQMWVPENKCGMIIGRGGSKIAEIQERSFTKVDVNSREKDDQGMCRIKITGTKDDCDKAKTIIEDIVAEPDRVPGDRAPLTDEPEAPGGEERGSMDIWVDTASLGRIIGRGGSKIKEIERNYKVKIDVKKDVQEEHETKVVLIGGKSAVLTARDYIYAIADEED